MKHEIILRLPWKSPVLPAGAADGVILSVFGALGGLTGKILGGADIEVKILKEKCISLYNYLHKLYK